jgi:uncharacterized membrane protein
VFVAPALVHAEKRDFDGYARLFEWLMAACGAATLALMAVAGAAPLALGIAALSPLALGSIVLARFDLWPVLLVVSALAALVSGRNRVAAATLGLAVAAKIFPLVLAPIGLAHVWRSRGRREAVRCALVFVGTVAAVFAPFVALAPHGVLHSITTQTNRPLQIESLGAALLLAVHHLGGIASLHQSTSHGSQNLAGPGVAVVAALATALQLTAIVWVWLLHVRGRLGLLAAAAAAVTAFVAFGKVLSPQFLIWLVPLVLLVRRRVAWAVLVAALVLTQVVFPAHYWPYARDFAEWESWVVLARDLVLVALFVALTARARGSPRTT